MVREEPHGELIDPLLSRIVGFLREKSGQFMVVGLDNVLLGVLVDKISKIGKLKPVFVKRNKDENPDGKIFFIKLQNTSSMEYQALLYHYLELPLSFDCFVCLTSVSSLSLTFFEKRVRSRFKNRVFFLPYGHLDGRPDSHAGVQCGSVDVLDGPVSVQDTINSEADGSNSGLTTKSDGVLSCANHEIHKSLEMRDQCEFMRKYGLERYSLKYMFDLLEPIHFVLIIMARSQKIVLNKCYDQFKHAVNNVPEIKRSPADRVLCCAYDLMDAGIISSSGSLAVSFGEFKEFIGAGAPLYIQKLLRTMSRSRQ